MLVEFYYFLKSALRWACCQRFSGHERGIDVGRIWNGTKAGHGYQLGSGPGIGAKAGHGLEIRMGMGQAWDGYRAVFAKHNFLKCSIPSFCRMHIATAAFNAILIDSSPMPIP